MKLFNEICGWLAQPKHLFIYYVIALAIPNMALTYTENYSFMGSLCNIILPVSVYAYLFTIKRKPGLMVWILFPIVFFAAFQLVLLYLFGNSIIAVDMFLNVVTTSPGEAMELLDNLVPAVLGVFILYLPALFLGIHSIRTSPCLENTFVNRVRYWAKMGMAAGLVFLGVTSIWDKDYDWKVDLYPANICYNLYLAGERTYITANYHKTSKGFKFNSHSSHPDSIPEIHMLVIGETGRACNWELFGYGRETNPMLKKTAGVVAFPHVLTQSNTTHKSVPMLLSAASAENFTDLYHQKGIISAFKEAGFYTAFFSNQYRNHSFIDFIGEEADKSIFLKDKNPLSSHTVDKSLMPLVDQILKEGHHKLFIVLHTYGSHFNYRERYDDSIAKFKPDSLTEAEVKNRPWLLNAYDNTIVNTDFFLSQLMQKMEKTGTVSSLLYVSDHGEDIFDDERELFLHASPKPSYYQLHVPFIVWTSTAYREYNPLLCETLERNSDRFVSSSVSTFHSMLDLGGVETSYKNNSLSVADSVYCSGKQLYLNDHNLPKTFDQINMTELDFEQLHLKGFSN